MDPGHLPVPPQDVPCSLVLLRPDVSLGLTSLETNLTAEHLERLLKRLEHTGSVAIMMPMLHLRQTIEMSKVLSCLGAKDLFGGGHALGGIASNRPLSASLLVHSVSLKVSAIRDLLIEHPLSRRTASDRHAEERIDSDTGLDAPGRTSIAQNLSHTSKIIIEW